jgi:sugar phosphate isomerase/epimerase
MIQLAFSTNAFKKHSLDEAISAIARAGYGGVELMADKPHCDPAAFDAEQRRQLHTRLDELQLTVSNVNAFTLFARGDTYHPTWIEDDQSRRQERIQHTLGAIELAAEFEANTVSLQPGGPLIGVNLTRAAASERFAEGLNRVLPAARRQDVILAVEPEPGLLIQTADEYLSFKQQFFPDAVFLGMNCDIGHLFCVGDDPAAVIGRMPREIAHVHLEDIDSNRVHQHLAPGKGVIDFKAVFTALRKIGYLGWVTVELYPYETTPAAVAAAAHAFLRPLL